MQHRHGWPSIATGHTDIGDLKRYIAWRKALKLPEESVDFSDRDAFDVAEFLISSDASYGEYPLVIKRDQLGAESLSSTEAEALRRHEEAALFRRQPRRKALPLSPTSAAS